MVTKKRATPKVAEAAREYTAHSRHQKEGALGESIWELFTKLPDEEQGAFLHKLLHDPEWLEELIDSISIIQSEGEPGRPFEEYVAEVERERAK